MPTEQQLLDAKAKREQRRSAREATTKTALEEQEKLSALSQKQAEEKADGTFKAPAPVKRKSRAEMMADRKVATKAQADKDALMMPEPVKTEGALAQYRERGETPPLHLLNAIAAEADASIRDEARQIANAAGKAAFDLAVGRRGKHDPVNRHRRMRDQIAVAEKLKKDVK